MNIFSTTQMSINRSKTYKSDAYKARDTGDTTIEEKSREIPVDKNDGVHQPPNRSIRMGI